MQRLRPLVFAVLSSALMALSGGDTIPSFDGGANWLKTPTPLTAGDLRGNVVLVDFWEYSCTNCLRTLPYLREWYHRYHHDGFVIVGVHTPEFSFTGEVNNVAAATRRLRVSWPVVLDDGYAIWNRYGIDAWPTELLFDQHGMLVESQSGEGSYQKIEASIQSLLRKENPHLTLPPLMALLPRDSYTKPGAVCYPQTAEMLMQSTPIGNPVLGDRASDLTYRDRAGHEDGNVYLDGYWHASKEALVFGGGMGYVDIRYHAIQVDTVLAPTGSATRVTITQDGKPILPHDAGPDIRFDADGTSYVMVDSARSYDLLMNQRFGEHDLRLYPQRRGLAIYDAAFESCEVPRGA